MTYYKNINGHSLINMQSLFSNCNNLKFINIYLLEENEQSKDISNIFSGITTNFVYCIKDESKIPTIITKLSGHINNCSFLSELTIEDSINTTTILTTIPNSITTILTTISDSTILTTIPITTILTTIPDSTIITTIPLTNILATIPDSTIITTIPLTNILATMPDNTTPITSPIFMTTFLTTFPTTNLILNNIITSILTTILFIDINTTPFLDIEIPIIPSTTKDPVIEYNTKDFLSYLLKSDNKINDESKNEDISKDDIINNIKNEITNGGMDTLVSNIIREKKDLVLKDEDVTIYQITTSDNQNNNEYNNISTIQLGECENKLKKHYNIANNESLLIFKIDLYNQGLSVPKIEYEIYHPKTKEKLDLDICKDTKINISIPVSINEDNLYKYDSSSDYYNDICFTYTSEKGTDISLNDRKKEFINNNMSLCEVNCEFNGYNNDTKKSLCECQVKIKLPIISEIVINKDELLNNFFDVKKSINLKVLKCYYKIFKKEGIQKNIGNYIILSIILLSVILIVIFYIKGFNILKRKIKQKLLIKKLNENKMGLNEVKSIKKASKKRKKKEKLKNFEFQYEKGKNNKNKNIKIKKNPPIKKETKTKIKIKQFIMNDKVGKSSSSKIEINNNNSNIQNINKSIQITTRNSKDFNSKINYNDYELNSMLYNLALLYDKRTYLQYYISLLKTRHIVIFSFYTSNDYNSKAIKILLFLFSFALYYAVNALFFNDSTMHKIYEDEGNFNIIYQIPQIIYSTIISSVVNTLLRTLSLSEKNILIIKNEKNKNEKVIKNLLKCLQIKFACFFICDLLLLILFWFYLSCFCAIYINTQIHVLKDTLISFCLSLLYPFGLYLIPGIFRIPALRAKNRNKETLYKFSKIIQLL